MNKSRTISLIQASAILISSMIGVGVLDVPRMAATTADSGAPLITLIGIAVAFLALWFTTILGMRFPRETIFQYSRHIIGRPLAFFFQLMYLFVFCHPDCFNRSGIWRSNNYHGIA
ncbi:GerAB/ArcD/ProY family transporter [Paenibacillus antarcticus]|uniref:GerAB/ArcD/ProY family transporter n=1 Tax=Paenibacillus antarcticus TaxID=253703 RepID=UPI000AEDE5BC|nr:GerAB/ArcD/ProY family transporter [Paenibacillus antarcticus]